MNPPGSTAEVKRSGSWFRFTGCLIMDYKDPDAEERMVALWINFLGVLVFNVCSMIAGIVGHSMAMVSDSTMGLVDVLTYGLSIYAQSEIDSTNDVRRMKKIGMFSGFFGATTLIAMAIILSILTVYDMIEKIDDEPSETIMLVSGSLNFLLNIVCVVVMLAGAHIDSFLPWLMGADGNQDNERSALIKDVIKSEGKEGAINDPCYGTGAASNPLPSMANPDPEELAIDNLDVEDHHQASSALNVGSSMIHLLTDTMRSVVVITAAFFIFGGSDANKVDNIASLLVNSFAVYMGLHLLLEAQRTSQEIDEPLIPWLAKPPASPAMPRGG